MKKRIFLLSPASTGGQRARMLMSEKARFELATRLRAEGATLGEVFAFLSGLYFRGKLAYAEKFAAPPSGVPGALVITAGKGILPSRSQVTHELLREFSAVDIHLQEERYTEPLARDLKKLRQLIGAETEVVLLGSVATGKYVEPLLECFGEQLHYPKEFKGRGDMSRGALLLRAVRAEAELVYQSLYPHGLHRPKRKRSKRRTTKKP